MHLSTKRDSRKISRGGGGDEKFYCISKTFSLAIIIIFMSIICLLIPSFNVTHKIEKPSIFFFVQKLQTKLDQKKEPNFSFQTKRETWHTIESLNGKTRCWAHSKNFSRFNNSQQFVGERFYKSTLKGHSAIIQTFICLMTTRLDIIAIILLFIAKHFYATRQHKTRSLLHVPATDVIIRLLIFNWICFLSHRPTREGRGVQTGDFFCF